MYGLLYKEIVINKKNLLGVAAVFLLLSAVMFIPSEDGTSMDAPILTIVHLMISIMIFLVVGMFQQGIFEADETKLWQSYICSTPGGLQNQLRVKYVFTFVLSIITAFCCSVVHMLSCAVFDINAALPITVLFLTQIFFRSIEIPFIVAFGSKYGNTFRSVVVGIIVFAGMVYALFGDLTVFGSFDSITNFLVNHIISEDGFSQNFTDILYIVPALIYLLYYISYKISCKFYLKGGEHYDR